MDFSLIVDPGAFSVKYAGQAKRNRRKDWADSQVREMSTATASLDASVDCEALQLQTLARLVSAEVQQGEDLSLVLLVDTLASRRLRESLFQVAFEHLGAKKVAMCFTAATALFAAGETTGVAVDLGFFGVRVTPVDRGVPVVAQATGCASVGCAAIDASILEIIRAADPDAAARITDAASWAEVTRQPAYAQAKGQLCSFADGAATGGRTAAGGDEYHNPNDPVCEFALPDGSSVRVPASPSVVSQATRPLLYSACANVPFAFRAVHQQFSLDVSDAPLPWLCFGGGAAVRGAGGELAAALETSMIGAPARQLTTRSPGHAPVEGALILTHLSSFKAMSVSLAEYGEDGPAQCVHVRCVDSR